MYLNFKLIFSLSLVIVAVLYRTHLEVFCKHIISLFTAKEEKNALKVFSSAELSLYRGKTKKNLYVAVLGTVFDVSKGKNHYAEGSPYHYFTGKDGSRALITGDFQDESENRDHIMDLSCDDLLTLVNWRSTFRKKYKRVGILEGRYFDQYGKKTTYYEDVINNVEHCKHEKEVAKQNEQDYPPCNMEWSEEHGSKVWCTQNSGGITRDWVGVPRQYYEPGAEKSRCACVKDGKNVPVGLIKEYDNCLETSNTCILPAI